MKKISFMLCAAALMLASTFTSCTNEDNSIYENNVVIRNGYYLNDIIADAIEKSTGNDIVVNLPDTIALRTKDYVEIPEGKNVSIIGKKGAPARVQLKYGFLADANLTIKNVEIDAQGLNSPIIAYAAENTDINFDGVTIKNNYNELVDWNATGAKVTFTNSDISFSQIYSNAIVTIKDSKIKPSYIIFMGINDVIIENTEIDAENNWDPIFMLKYPYDLGFEGPNDKGYFVIEEPIVLKGIKVKNAKDAIFSEYAWWDEAKLVVKNFTIDDCVFELNPMENKNFVISFNKGGILNFTIQNSTVYNISEEYNFKYFMKWNEGNFPDKVGVELNEGDVSITYKDNTFYKIASNWFVHTKRVANAASKYDVDIENNIWADCAVNQGGILRRLLSGKKTNQVHSAVVNGNTYLYHDADGNVKFEDASTYDVTEGQDIQNELQFADPLNGDFHCGAQNGDPRWK